MQGFITITISLLVNVYFLASIFGPPLGMALPDSRDDPYAIMHVPSPSLGPAAIEQRIANAIGLVPLSEAFGLTIKSVPNPGPVHRAKPTGGAAPPSLLRV